MCVGLCFFVCVCDEEECIKDEAKALTLSSTSSKFVYVCDDEKATQPLNCLCDYAHRILKYIAPNKSHFSFLIMFPTCPPKSQSDTSQETH